MCRIKLKRIGITQEPQFGTIPRQKCFVVVVVILTKDCNMKDWERYIYKF